MSGSILLGGALAALGLGILLLAVNLLPAPRGRGGVAGALAAIEKHYSRDAATAGPGGAGQPTALPGWLRRLALRLSPSGFTETLQRRLDLAGNPARWNPDRVLAVKGLGLVVLGALGGLYGLHSPALFVLCAGFGGLVGFFLPDVLLYNSGTKRQAQIQAALPDALDMLTVCVEAGLGFDAGLAQVARNTTGPLAAEFARALQEMQIGVSRTEALRAMVGRSSVPEFRAFVSALIQATELGITVAQVLREQALEMRLRRRQRAEEKAQKVPVKILFPLIFCLFPALFVVILAPGAINAFKVLFGG
jgi:tight adherence protein C